MQESFENDNVKYLEKSNICDTDLRKIFSEQCIHLKHISHLFALTLQDK